ncbi:hypothetical protein CLHUN_29140 [Ruminiclostridium hungatei]|uniref:TspO/MBR family protein n=1 Tax=Ruminiclostridium hungatei TaxID=48256 RepID=A0A1V4SH87_RUMHU|nr:hypothetical protein [Ruminiclostridium hungatei]OPX43164.1 hypothetical protein CLHUN_29140 [Ruminiclostridium hungatei]
MLYIVWVIITAISAIWGIAEYWPCYGYSDISMPLFTDFTTIAVFLPCYFILCWLCIHFIYCYLGNFRLKAAIVAYFSIIAFISSLIFLDIYSLLIRVLVSFSAATVTFIYYFVTVLLYNNSPFRKPG